MIKTRKDLNDYLDADKTANGWKGRSASLLGDEIRKFLVSLRHAEYHFNFRDNWLNWLAYAYWKMRNHSAAVHCGFSIPLNVLGPGIKLAHRGTIVINSKAKIGGRSTIHVCVNIGTSGGSKDAPQIGDEVYIGPGAKIFGGISIAKGVVIGANAVVRKTIPTEYSVWAGVPAKQINTSSKQQNYSQD